eukprot:3867139-Pleurochrysis_carterae.AAC.1
MRLSGEQHNTVFEQRAQIESKCSPFVYHRQTNVATTVCIRLAVDTGYLAQISPAILTASLFRLHRFSAACGNYLSCRPIFQL